MTRRLPRVDLSNTDNQRRWTNMLERATQMYDSSYFRDLPKTSEFVKEMIRRNQDERPLWNPTVSQWNYLHTIVNGGDYNG